MITVQALDSHRCAQHLTGTIRHRHRFENALHAATALARQSQGHRRLRPKATVSTTFKRKTRTQTHISPRRIIVIAVYRLLSLRDFQDNKGDVILKYTADEARTLKSYGELPEHAKINETDSFGQGEDGEAYFEFGDADSDDDSSEDGGDNKKKEVDIDDI